LPRKHIETNTYHSSLPKKFLKERKKEGQREILIFGKESIYQRGNPFLK